MYRVGLIRSVEALIPLRWVNDVSLQFRLSFKFLKMLYSEEFQSKVYRRPV